MSSTLLAPERTLAPPPAAARSSVPPTGGQPPATEFAWRVLEEIDYGLILLSAAGVLQHANHIARRELARGRFLRPEGSGVATPTAVQTEAFRRAVGAASQGRRQMLSLRHGEDTLPVACVPLSGQAEDARPSPVLVMLARQPDTRNLALSFFARSHGLTPAEEAVLKALCDGLDVRDIATAHGVTEYTVRTQVRSLRDKTGAGSMRLLVQRVAALPPVVPMWVGEPASSAA